MSATNKSHLNELFKWGRDSIKGDPTTCRMIMRAIPLGFTDKQVSTLRGRVRNELFEAAKRSFKGGGWVGFPLRLAKLQSLYGAQITYAQARELAIPYYAASAASLRIDPPKPRPFRGL